VIESGEAQQRIDVVLSYEADSERPRFPVGDHQHRRQLVVPEIIIKQEEQKVMGRKR